MPANALYRRIRDMGLFAGTPLSPRHDPAVKDPYTGRQKKYFAPETDDFNWENAKYASNYYAAQVQGVIPGTGRFEDIRGARIRTMDIVEQSTGTQLPNDWQNVVFQDHRIQGLYTGAKLWFGGNTWICTAPRSVASDSGNAVIRRCTAIWNHMDFYGNVLTEPFVWAKGPANATANEYLDYNSIAHDYQKCVMQLNDETKELRIAHRIVLGSGVYEVAGIVDFISDFSQLVQEDGSTLPRQKNEPCHIMYFDLYKSEPIRELDDLERGIAGGLAFKWKIMCGTDLTVQTGTSVDLGIYSLRSDAETKDVPVYDTEEHPITYLYGVSDNTVADVDASGRLTALEAGETTVTVTLAQNPEIRRDFTVTVTSAQTGEALELVPDLPESMNVMGTAQAHVLYTVNGIETTADITVSANGPEDYAYSVELDGNTLTVRCWESSVRPLDIEIRCGATSVKRRIQLRGLQ